MIEKINNGPKLSLNTMIVTWDVMALFTNRKHNEGLEDHEKKLDTREDQKVSTDFLIKTHGCCFKT